jgi:hypothetical protein
MPRSWHLWKACVLTAPGPGTRQEPTKGRPGSPLSRSLGRGTWWRKGLHRRVSLWKALGEENHRRGLQFELRRVSLGKARREENRRHDLLRTFSLCFIVCLQATTGWTQEQRGSTWDHLALSCAEGYTWWRFCVVSLESEFFFSLLSTTLKQTTKPFCWVPVKWHSVKIQCQGNLCRVSFAECDARCRLHRVFLDVRHVFLVLGTNTVSYNVTSSVIFSASSHVVVKSDMSIY